MFSIIFVILFGLIYASAEKCDLNFVDFPSKGSMPLRIFLGKFDWFPFKDDGIHLDTTDQILFACPGNGNKFESVNGNPINTTCIGKKTLRIERQGPTKTLSELNCVKPITGEVERPGNLCESDGQMIHIGHRIVNQFLPIIDVCFNDVSAVAFYSKHTIYGSSIKNASKSSCRPNFKSDGLITLSDPQQYYKIETEKKTFEVLLGSGSLITKSSYLARGHLSPDKDQVFASRQQSTYFYINAVPQWQQINNGNWKSLENALKTVSCATRENFEVYTGTFGVLALENNQGQPINIYLAGTELPVPKFIWKVFHSTVTRKGIAFINLNNPFITTTTSDDYLCTDICDQYGWINPSWKVLSKGIIYCCQIDDLKMKVPYIPHLDVRGIQTKNIAPNPDCDELMIYENSDIPDC